MIKKYDPDYLTVRDAASVLELDSSLISKLIRNGRLKFQIDEHSNRKYLTEADLIDYLSSKLPSGYVATAQDNLTIN